MYKNILSLMIFDGVSSRRSFLTFNNINNTTKFNPVCHSDDAIVPFLFMISSSLCFRDKSFSKKVNFVFSFFHLDLAANCPHVLLIMQFVEMRKALLSIFSLFEFNELS